MSKKPTYEELEQRIQELEQAESDRRQIEEQMRFLSSSMELIYEGTAITDTEGVLIHVNQTWAEMHGYESPKELVGRHLSIFHNAGQMKNDVEPFNAIVIKKGYCKREVGHIRDDGMPFSTLMTSTLLKDENGNPKVFLYIAKDITGIKRLEEVIGESEKKYRAIFDNAIEGILIATEGRIAFANPAFEKMLGHKKEVFTSKPFTEFIHPDDREMVLKKYQKRIAGEDVETAHEFRIINASGEERWVEIHSNILEWEGAPSTLTFITDITDRKRSEEKVRKSEERLKAVLSASPVGIGLIVNRKIDWANETMYRMVGYEHNALLGQTAKILYPDKEEFERVGQKLYDGLEESGTGQVETRWIRKDGTVFNCIIRICALDPAEPAKGQIAAVTDITDSKRAEKALEKSEEKHRALIENLSEMILILDKDGVNRWNSPAVRQYGMEPEDAIGINAREYTHPDDLDRVDKALKYVVEHPGEIITLEGLKAVVDDGRIIHLDDTFVYLPDTPGINGIVVTCRDVSARKQAEEALASSERRFKELIKNSSDSIVILDKDGLQTFVSDAVEKHLGYKPSEVINISVIEEMIHPDDQEKTLAAFNQIIQEGQGTVQYRHKHKNGSWVHFEAWGTNQLGNPDIKGVVVNVRNITEWKESEAALKESEARYRFLADNMTDNLWTFDLSTMRYSYFSPSVYRIMGFTPEEVVNSSFEDIMTPASYEFASKILAEELLEASRHYDPSRSKTLEVELYHKDGRTIWVEASVRFIYDSDHRPAALLGVTRDISERKRLQDQLQKAQKMESLGLLAGGVAHDLNNVLSGIVSYPELILMNLPNDSKLRKPLETIHESGLRAAAIVQDLLTVARGVATTKAPLNLNDVIMQYLSSPEYNEFIKNYPAVEVKIDLDDTLLNINASQVHIQKVVMNLVVNAAEAIKGSGKVVISTVNRYLDKPIKGYDEISRGEYTVLSISDDGSGISSNDLERIFEPFYTKKKMGRSGTGLGLSVVWNVMQDHNGYIDVDTDESGATFALYFPITREVMLKNDMLLSVQDYKGNGETILVVDDEEKQQEISCNILDALGYRSESVSSGEAAVEYLKENSVDLLLLDMIMDPGINGYETFKRIIRIHPGQKAIILSGFSETDEVKKTQDLGAGRFLKKPVTIEKIGLAVKEELSK